MIEGLTGLYDIERLASKVSLGSINAREMLSLKHSLAKLPFLKECASKFEHGLFRQINENLDPLEDIYDLLDKSIAEDPPVVITEGDIIKPGYDKECDELRDIASNARTYIMELESRERERTGVKTLKIGYNRVFGYYVEVPRSVTELPEEYTRKQTLANNERYISPELKELEEKILGATSKRTALEYQLFTKIRETVKDASDRLFGSASSVALIDVVTSLAQLANEENYVRPVIDDSDVLEAYRRKVASTAIVVVLKNMGRVRRTHQSYIDNDKEVLTSQFSEDTPSNSNSNVQPFDVTYDFINIKIIQKK